MLARLQLQWGRDQLIAEMAIFFLQGLEDFTTPTELARRYLASIKAPRKEFVPLKGGGHFTVFMNSGQFLEVLIKLVRPLALRH